MLRDVVIDLNPNTEWSFKIYTYKVRCSQDVALKRAFVVCVAAVDTNKKREKKNTFK